MRASLCLFPILLAACPTSAAGAPVADCESTAFTTTVVTYYEEPDQPATSRDPRCTIVEKDGKSVCRIALRGVLHSPVEQFRTKAKLPALLFNHGSEHTFDGEGKGCGLAAFFAPLGYQVFLPFRRGHGEDDPATGPGILDDNMSSGDYISDRVASFPNADDPTECKTAACYRVELMNQQVDDVAEGYKWLAARDDVDPGAIAIMGYSYGGIMTVLANRQDLGQRAVVPMAPGSLSYGDPEIRTLLRNGAAQAKTPAFYLVAKWDRNNFNVPDLVYAHSRRTGETEDGTVCGTPELDDDAHGDVAQMAIFDYPKSPSLIPVDSTGKRDYQAVHSGFSRHTEIWGPPVLEFLQRNGVK